MVDVGEQHVGAVEAQRAIAVAGNDDVAVALHDLLADRHPLHAVVAAHFAARQRLSGEDGIERFVGAAVGMHLRLGRALVGPAEAAHHHRPATETGLQAGFGPVGGNDHHRRVLHLPWQVPKRVWHSAGAPASACCGGPGGVIDCALRMHSTKDGAMSMILRGLLALACAGAAGVATAAVPAGPQIVTEDVSRFYALYDSAGSKPSVAQLRGYMAEGSTGLAELAKARRVTPERIAESIANQPELYAQGRRCLAELPAVKQRLTQVFSQPAGHLPAGRVSAGDHRGRPWPSGRADLEKRRDHRPGSAVRSRFHESQCAGSLRPRDRARVRAYPADRPDRLRAGRPRMRRCCVYRWARASPSSSPS